jgi:lysophospholipase L1-like esterase
MKRNKAISTALAFVLCGGLMVLPSTSPPAAAATSWPITADVSPAAIEAVGDNKLSLLDCGQSYSEKGPGTPAQSFYLDGIRKPSSTYTGGTYVFLPWGTCSPGSTISTADGTFYTGVHRGEWGPSGFIKEKNGRTMWTVDIKACPSKQYKYGSVTAMEMGANNRLYVTLRSEATYNDCADRFVIIDAITGKVIADKPLAAGQGYIVPRIWVYANKAVVLDHEGYAYHFDLNGNQIGEASDFLLGKNAFNVWADGMQNVYSYTMGDNYCRTDSPLKLRKFSASRQVTVAYTFPSTVTCDMRSSTPLPGGSVGVLEQYQSNLKLTRYTPTGANVSIDGVIPVGYSEDPIRIDADTAGNVLYVAYRNKYIGAGKYDTGVVIRLFNFATRSVAEIWNSKSAISGSSNVYSLGIGDIYSGYLYLPACITSCIPVSQIASRIYKIALPGFGTKYQTSGSFVPLTLSTKRKYVAMGDSFSSGEGNPLFDQQTDIGQGGSNNCHRSPVAYPNLLAADPTLNLELVDFVACSGATTTDLLSGSNGGEGRNEPAQINALSNDTNVVSLTVGGNDIKFKEFATACALNSCGMNSLAYKTSIDKIHNELPSKLITVYRKIAEKAPKAHVYIVGYPQIAPKQMPTGPNSICWPLNGGSNSDTNTGGGPAAYSIVSELNASLQRQVNVMNASSDPDYFHFVDPNGANSPFIGHDWCSSSRYFSIIAINNTEYSFHPNSSGHTAYKTIIKENMK